MTNYSALYLPAIDNKSQYKILSRWNLRKISTLYVVALILLRIYFRQHFVFASLALTYTSFWILFNLPSCPLQQNCTTKLAKLTVHYNKIELLNCNIVFYDWKHHLEPLGRGGAVKISFHKGWIAELINDKGVCRAAPGFSRVC